MTVSAEVIAASVSSETGKPIVTWKHTAPRNIHAEFMTHRVFSRNASSSRAIPLKRMHANITDNPALPEKWTLNEPGMQGYREASPDIVAEAKRIIARHRIASVECAEELAALGLHKQIFNRYTEAHQHITVVVTTTELDNFNLLRLDEGADPTMQGLARVINEAIQRAEFQELRRGQWHTPFFTWEEEEPMVNEFLDLRWDQTWQRWAELFTSQGGTRAAKLFMSIAISAARCARTSYNNFDGSRSSSTSDLELFKKLFVSQPIHASPIEHQATPDWMLSPRRLYREYEWANSNRHGNLVGWQQARKFIPGENGIQVPSLADKLFDH